MLGSIGTVAVATAVAAIATGTTRPLLSVTSLLCFEELAALELGTHPATGSALAFTVVLFVGVELAYWACTNTHNRETTALYARSVGPIAVVSIAAAGLVAALADTLTTAGLGFVALGVAASLAVLGIAATLVLRMDGPTG